MSPTDADSFVSPINSQSHLTVNVCRDNFHDAREELPKPDEQPGQEKQAEDVNPITVAANQARLIVVSVQSLDINYKGNADVGSATEDEFSKAPGSLSNNFEPGAKSNADAGTLKSNLSLTPSKQQERDLMKKFDNAFNEKFPNLDSFYEKSFNEAGPNTETMETMLDMLAERIDINEGAGTELDLMECDISHKLHTFLESEGDL